VTAQEFLDATVLLGEAIRNSNGRLNLTVMWQNGGFVVAVFDDADGECSVAEAAALTLTEALVGVHDALVAAGEAAVAL
jgi:hypothetical protein